MTKPTRYDWHAYGRRLRLVRAALDISEVEAAAAHGVTLRTYRRYEAGAPQRAGEGFLNFAAKYDVSLNWLISGDGTHLGRHLSKNKWGKVAILPAAAALSDR